VRIEDIDAARVAARTTEQAIYDDLAWLGSPGTEPVAAAEAAFRRTRAALGASLMR
jgi:glutamyl/glutaminyl-tRNA synthetase